jgi:hypothetical protein
MEDQALWILRNAIKEGTPFCFTATLGYNPGYFCECSAHFSNVVQSLDTPTLSPMLVKIFGGSS